MKTRKTLFETVTGRKKFDLKTDSVKSKPISDFISFKETQTILNHQHRRSTENALTNGSIRSYAVSPNCGKARMIYKPDVLLFKAALENRKKADGEDG